MCIFAYVSCGYTTYSFCASLLHSINMSFTASFSLSTEPILATLLCIINFRHETIDPYGHFCADLKRFNFLIPISLSLSCPYLLVCNLVILLLETQVQLFFLFFFLLVVIVVGVVFHLLNCWHFLNIHQPAYENKRLVGSTVYLEIDLLNRRSEKFRHDF